MEKISVNFYVSTGYVNAHHEQVIEIEVPKSATDEEVESMIQEEFDEWVQEKISAKWTIL